MNINCSRTRTACLQCRKHLLRRSIHASTRLYAEKEEAAPIATTAPKRQIDIKHIRANPELHEQNCLDRNYKTQSTYPTEIISLSDQVRTQSKKGLALRQRNNALQSRLQKGDFKSSRAKILEEARKVKEELLVIDKAGASLNIRIHNLAAAIPNLTSNETPRGNDFKVLAYINDHPDPSLINNKWRDHVDIGKRLSIIDLPSAATVSGSGWYYLLDEGALLEQALIQYTLQTALTHGFQIVSPPSLVYSHMSHACGFQPRDLHREQQVYRVAQAPTDRRPELSLAGTAEIPLAGMKANTVISMAELPIKKVAVSRCYRAEAGSHGIDTKGLYRVHEFTKVELFAWSNHDLESALSVFKDILALQIHILRSLDLHCRILEMPSADLGASAYRKVDMETFFPSRRSRDEGWGEVTSTSICTDYQTRRLGTKLEEGGYPWTVNGTAMAVPRVLAAILENGWNEAEGTVKVPEVLRPWMGRKEVIGPKETKK